MPLNIVSSNVEPYLKYNAKSGEWTVVKDSDDVRTITAPVFLADFEGIRPGWLRFREGQAPERVLDPSPGVSGPQPDESYKRGFVLDVYLRGDGKLKFSSASLHTCRAVEELYEHWERERLAHPGLCAVVKCLGVEAKKDRYGVNHRPVLTITGWGKWPAPDGNGEEWSPPTMSRPQIQSVVPPEPPLPSSAADYGFDSDDDCPF
jgi:hypothetical protein